MDPAAPKPPANALEAAFRAAVALQRAARLSEAEVQYRALLATHPALTPARRNLVALLRAKGCWDEAETELRAAASLDPTDPDLRYDLAISLLAAGDYARGWPLYEARREVQVERVEPPALDVPEWRGQAVESLLVWGEQGFGDQLQFVRYVPMLRARGIEVTLVCRPELARLFSVFGVRVIAAVNQARLPRCDAWVLMGSLPRIFDTRLETIPPAAWLPGAEGGAGLGVMARGRESHADDVHRSMPAEAADALLALPGAISLQPRDTGARDFQDTAEIVRGLKRVITVDTAIAHLAGAMGKPVWILLPAVGVDWRWSRDRADSPWYPSARLFRQPAPGDWSAVLAEVRARL